MFGVNLSSYNNSLDEEELWLKATSPNISAQTHFCSFGWMGARISAAWFQDFVETRVDVMIYINVCYWDAQ